MWGRQSTSYPWNSPETQASLVPFQALSPHMWTKCYKKLYRAWGHTMSLTVSWQPIRRCGRKVSWINHWLPKPHPQGSFRASVVHVQKHDATEKLRRSLGTMLAFHMCAVFCVVNWLTIAETVPQVAGWPTWQFIRNVQVSENHLVCRVATGRLPS